MLLLIILGPLLVLLLFVAYDTIRRRGEFGIALESPRCPACSFKLARSVQSDDLRLEAPNRSTCSVCGYLADQWGTPLKQADLLNNSELNSSRSDESEYNIEGVSRVDRLIQDSEQDK